MEAKTNLNGRLPSRYVTEDAACAPHRSIAGSFELADVAEVFKRTPCLPDLKPGGQLVAKDSYEADCIPLVMKTLLDGGFLHGKRGAISVDARSVNACSVVTGCGGLDAGLSDTEFEERRAAWQPPELAFGSGYLWQYSRQIEAARHGAVPHPGGLAEKTCYANI